MRLPNTEWGTVTFLITFQGALFAILALVGMHNWKLLTKFYHGGYYIMAFLTSASIGVLFLSYILLVGLVGMICTRHMDMIRDKRRDDKEA